VSDDTASISNLTIKQCESKVFTMNNHLLYFSAHSRWNWHWRCVLC